MGSMQHLAKDMPIDIPPKQIDTPSGLKMK